MASRVCWNCENMSHMTRVGYPYPVREVGPLSVAKFMWFALFRCDACGFGSMGSLVISANEANSTYGFFDEVQRVRMYSGNQQEIDRAAVGCAFDDIISSITWYPDRARGKKYDDVPENIASAASEAYSCFSIGAYRAAAMMSRSVVEAIAIERGITKGDLKTKITELGKRNLLTPLAEQQADEIRFFGNDVVHGGFTKPVSADEANGVLIFLDVLIDSVYQQPAKLHAMQESRAKRKEQKTA